MSGQCSSDVTRFLKSRAIMGGYCPVACLPTSPKLGNVLVVDSINGNDTTASPGGLPYKTVDTAVSAATSGTTVWIMPGTYNLTAGIVLPAGISIRGVSVQTCIVQMANVTANTTLMTMGASTRVEDLTLNLTSAGHYTLTGIVFPGTTTQTAKLRTCVLTINNSGASVGGTSVVTGVLASGTDGTTATSFSFNSLKGSTVNVYSNGGGNKRGILVSGMNAITTRDMNVYVASPTNTASTGSYVGIETNDPASSGSIQLRSTTVGTFLTTISGTTSDILQTTPATISSPAYLASPGIQIGPGSDLVTKTAGGRGFSTYVYPTVIYYGLRGSMVGGGVGSGYLWPGTQAVSASFPDTGTPPAYFRIQQPCILAGMSVGLNLSCGPLPLQNFLTFTVRKTPISTGILVDTSYTLTLSGGELASTYYNASVNFATGDYLSTYLSIGNAGGGNANRAHDVTLQLDLF
jgi:hypothetical protein